MATPISAQNRFKGGAILGFNASQPKADPKVAGSAITVGGQRYSFGYLGTLFFESDELSAEFPK